MQVPDETASPPPTRSHRPADRFLAVQLEALNVVARHVPGGWAERRGDAFGLLTRIRIPNLNGVVCTSPAASPSEAAALLDRVVQAGVPHSLQLRSGSSVDLIELARASGMSLAEDLAAMVLRDTNLVPAAPAAPIALRRLGPEERGLHCAVAASGFQVPEAVLAPLVEALTGPASHLYVGEVDGEPVVTGLAMRVSDAVGIFNVATTPRRRRRGYAGALTARAVLDGLDEGATWAFLQSSTMAEGVYERLGFRTVERWQLWVGGPRGF